MYNIYISYRLWTLNNFELDKKSTRGVEKIISYYTLSPDVAEKLYNDKQIKIYDNTYVNKDLFSGINRVKSYIKNSLGQRKLFIFRWLF